MGLAPPPAPSTTYAEKRYEDVYDSIGVVGLALPAPSITCAEKDYEDVDDSIGGRGLASQPSMRIHEDLLNSMEIHENP